jgi:uncharacterized protein YqgC (DUF456 family)
MNFGELQAIGYFALRVLVAVVMLIGLFGLVIPVVPGLTIIWLAALVYGLAAGFNGWIFGIITVLMIIGNISDNFVMGAKAHEKGASWLAIIASLAAGVIGSIILTPLGGLIAALVVLFLVEWQRLKDKSVAFGSMKNMVIGLGWSILIRFGIGAVMVALWGLWVYLAM